MRMKRRRADVFVIKNELAAVCAREYGSLCEERVFKTDRVLTELV